MQIRTVLTGALVATLFLSATAQQTRPQVRNTTAEFQLVGVRLFDSGSRVVSLFGSPDDILPLTASTTAGGGGGPAAGGGGGGASGSPGSPGAADMAPAATNIAPNVYGDPFGVGNSRQFSPDDDRANGGGEGGGRRGLSPGGDGGGEGGGSRGGGETGGGTGQRVTLTRWVYNRPTGRYAFVFDKFNRVVQIEALGSRDSRVRTRKGITYGATVQQLIQKYGAPDAYEIGGQHIILRYLVKDRVAFRLSRLKPKDKHRVTGVVVAAAKS